MNILQWNRENPLLVSMIINVYFRRTAQSFWRFSGLNFQLEFHLNLGVYARTAQRNKSEDAIDISQLKSSLIRLTCQRI